MGNVLVRVEITPEMLFEVSEVARHLGQFEGYRCGVKQRVKDSVFAQNVYANLALEGSTLSALQVEQLIKENLVGAVLHEVAQAKAFIHSYAESHRFRVESIKDMLTAFLLMNEGLPLDSSSTMNDPSQWNAHMKEALELMGVLFRYVRDERLIHPVVKGAIFHYEMKHIQPFVRYSEAVARLWHRLILVQYHPVFEWVPLEHLVKNHQQEYQEALGSENTKEGLQQFVAFMARMTNEALAVLLTQMGAGARKVSDRLTFARMHFGTERLTRKKYMQLFQNIGSATASRDLKAGLESGFLCKEGEKARTEYFFM